MKLFVATQILLASYFKMKLVHASSLKDIVGSGCQNSVQLSSDFTTDSGEMCTTCALCDGSNPNDIFKPKSSGVCIDCTAVEDTCANFRVTTTFDSAWLMEFVSLTPSSKPKEFDPKTVVIEGSTDASAWVELYNKESNALFENRSEPTEVLLNSNDTDYRYYRITFIPHDNTSKFYVGRYDLIPSYTKTCTSNIYQAITGEYIRPFETPEPTQEPTLTPTPAPTTEVFTTNLILDGEKNDEISGAWPVSEDIDGKFFHGTGGYLTWNKSIGTSDFKMNLDLKFQGLGTTAAAIIFSGGNFGFDGSGSTIFVEGSMFGGLKHLGPRTNYGVVDGKMVNVQIERKDSNFTVTINGEVAYSNSNINASITSVSLRPHRSQMKAYKWLAS